MSEVDRVSVLDTDQFRERYLRTSTPVVLTGAMEDWPARRKWSFDYLRERYGKRPVTVGRIQRGSLVVTAKSGVTQLELPLSEFLDSLQNGRSEYYMLTPVEERLPELIEDVRFPEVCHLARWKTSRVWMGAADTNSGLHRDWPENFFAQVVGRKRVILIDRREKARIYCNSWRSKAPNFSQVDAENPDFERFPRFREVTQRTVTVGPGEMLYIPRLWWHQVRSLDTSLSINLWFGNGTVAAVGALSQAYARVRGLRS